MATDKTKVGIVMEFIPDAIMNDDGIRDCVEKFTATFLSHLPENKRLVIHADSNYPTSSANPNPASRSP